MLQYICKIFFTEVTYMARKISDDCISCGTCAGVCPCDAIAEGADHYEINQDLCAQCGTCASNCPVEAIEEQ